MNLPQTQHHRRSIRLRGYDYTQAGAYFVTLVTQDRQARFGAIRAGEMSLNEAGQIVVETWQHLPDHYPQVELDEFCVMPNHVHGIIVFTDDGAMTRVAGDDDGHRRGGFETRPYARVDDPHNPDNPHPAGQRYPLSEIVRAFKTFSARRINEKCASPGQSFWQRNYYEHIIRSDADLERIRAYIAANPQRWAEDAENPDGGRR